MSNLAGRCKGYPLLNAPTWPLLLTTLDKLLLFVAWNFLLAWYDRSFKFTDILLSNLAKMSTATLKAIVAH